MAARVDTCKAKGFDAVKPDNVDGYTNSIGFPLMLPTRWRTTASSRNSRNPAVSRSA